MSLFLGSFNDPLRNESMNASSVRIAGIGVLRNEVVADA